jgi:hypothetical protein
MNLSIWTEENIYRFFHQEAKLVMLPQDEARFAQDLVLVRGTLEDVRLFHIMSLLSIASDVFASEKVDSFDRSDNLIFNTVFYSLESDSLLAI